MVDVVNLTRMSRILKVAEVYAVRLLEKRYGKEKATQITTELVNAYPEHGFPIYHDEAQRLGLNVKLLDEKYEPTLLLVGSFIEDHELMGRVVVAPEEK